MGSPSVIMTTWRLPAPVPAQELSRELERVLHVRAVVPVGEDDRRHVVGIELRA